MMTVTRIFFDEQYLAIKGQQLATKEQYMLSDRCPGSIFEALAPGEKIELAEGFFVLNDDLDPVNGEVKNDGP